MTSKSAWVKPRRAKSFLLAGAGPMPMIRGGTPAMAPPRMRAMGVRPCLFAAASEAMIRAAAPSLTPEALPAVTVPLGKSARSLPSVSKVVPARGCSSVSTTMGSPFFCGMLTGTISLARRPFFWPATALSWLRTANASCASRLTPNSWATFSPVSGMESTP